jgi:NAD(P)-dependent dehydrogenase (short-subunit alcohol dehydrogenase family)
MPDPNRLYGLNALVLNANGGIGEAIARTLVKHGADVVAVDTANSGVEQHYSTVRGITGMTARLLDIEKVPDTVNRAIQVLGSLDIVVTDFPLQPEQPVQRIDAALESLLHARALLMTAVLRAVLSQLKNSPQGRIINLGFLRSCFDIDAEAAFEHAKQDLLSLTRDFATETGEFGVSVNYIQPGAIMTPASREVFRKNQALRDYCINSSAAHRLGEPLDVAKVALFLASADAVFVSGAGVTVDGGRAVAT